MKYAVHYIFSFLLLLLFVNSRGQSGFYIPQKGKVFLNGDTATVFSNIINAGQFGIGKNAVLNFKGRKWENDLFAIITDESDHGNGVSGKGGEIIFLLPDETLSSAIDQYQAITGAYNAATSSGAAFPHLRVKNPWGIQLQDGSTKIRHQLNLDNGKILLNNNTLVIGDGYPGKITGYDENKFIVTGTGLLMREQLKASDGWVDFPVGANSNAYTPLSIRSKSNSSDNYFASVSDSVYKQVFTGEALSKGTVNKTWRVGKTLRPNEEEVELKFQHLLRDEGDLFKQFRHLTYVSHYDGQNWKKGTDHTLPLSPGNITSGSHLRNSATNTQLFNGVVGSGTYFTKFVDQFADTLRFKTKVWFTAHRVDQANVQVSWTTKPELSVQFFVVQRRLSNEQQFKNIDTVDSKALNGVSFSYLSYETNDPNNYHGVSYYRLMWVTYSGSAAYSQIVPVGNKPGKDRIMMWPNPARGRFYIGITNPSRIKAVVIWNAIGQKMQEITVNDRSLLEAYLFIPGTYVVTFVAHNNSIVETKKLLVTDRL